MSQIQLHADAALNAMADAGLKPKDIDGVATAGETPVQIAHYLGITPTWVDGTSVGGCSFMIHVRHAAAAIEAGLAKTILITHGESGRSRHRPRSAPGTAGVSLNGQFEQPFGPMGPPSMFTDSRAALHEDLRRDGRADCAGLRGAAGVGGEESARHLPEADHHRRRAELAHDRLSVPAADVLPGDRRRRRADPDLVRPRREFPRKPVYILGTGESVETPMVSQMEDFTSSRAFRVAGPTAFREAGISHRDVDHLMIYDAFAHLPIYGLEDLGFVPRGEAAAFIAERNTAPGGKLPLNTNGGGLSYMHSGMYGMYALQESVRQMRGIAAAQVEGAKISVCHGVGGMFAASGTIIFSNEAPGSWSADF